MTTTGEPEAAKPAGADGVPGAFGAPLRRHRGVAGLSQEELAERAGLSAHGLSDLERGARRAPRPDTVRRLAAALGLSDAARDALTAASLAATGRGAAGEGAPPEAPATAPAGRPPLPAPLTSLVGREPEVTALRQLLTATRLLTLTGPGGIGKTRLALAVAAGAADAAFADLAPLAGPALVPSAVAAALGVQESPGRTLSEVVATAAGPRPLLLVLDNCEHVLDASATLADSLLRACPGLQVLATSREPLSVAGEAVWPVPPLAVPAPGPESTDETGRLAGDPLMRFASAPAVSLFVERARAARSGFALTARTAPAVAEVCRRLDRAAPGHRAGRTTGARAGRGGAGRPVGGLLRPARFPRRRAPRRRPAPPHPTGDAGLELRPACSGRAAPLRAPGGLRRGFTLRAAEAVGADAPEPPQGAAPVAPSAETDPTVPVVGAEREPEIETGDVLDLVARLVDRSLVIAAAGESGEWTETKVDAEGGVRYRLLETVREYAAERLEDRGRAAAAAVRRRHAAYYASLVERAEAALWGPAQGAWLARLQTELGNIWAALAWSATRAGDATAGLRLGAGLWRFWDRRGHVSEARAHLTRLLDLAPQRTPARARGLGAAAYLAFLQGDLAAARALLSETLTVAQAVDDVLAEVIAHQGLGATALAEGDPVAAAPHFEQTLTLAQEAMARQTPAPDDVPSWFADAAAYTARYWLGEAVAAQGDLEGAGRLLEQCLPRMRARGDHWSVGIALFGLGRVALAQGAPARAATLLRESLALRRTLGDAAGVSHCLDELAQVAAAEGQPAQAARLFGAAVSLQERTGAAPWPPGGASRERVLAAVRETLGEATFTLAWVAGRALPPEQAVAEAPPEAPPSPSEA